MERRYGIVNVTKGQFFHRSTEETACAALRGLEEKGDIGFVVDGEAGQVVAASAIPFTVDVEQQAVRICGVGFTTEAINALRRGGLTVVEHDQERGLVLVREPKTEDLPAVSTVEVEGVRLGAETVKAMLEAGDRYIRAFVEGGELRVLVMPDPAPVPVAAIAVPGKGEPESLENHASVPEKLLGTTMALPISDIEVDRVAEGSLVDRVRIAVPGGADSSHSPLTVDDVVAEAQRGSGLTVAEWNELEQDARDAGIVAAEEVLHKCARANSEAARKVQRGLAGEGASLLDPAQVLWAEETRDVVEPAAAEDAAASEAPAQPAASSGADAPLSE